MAGGADEETRRTLDRVRRDSEIVGTSSLVRGAERPDEEDDAATRWGKRVGRGFSVVLAALLVWWLGIQLGWWAAP